MQKIYIKFGSLLVLMLSSFASDALTAAFTANHLSGCAPLIVNFTNSSSGATSYYWDFGNGASSVFTDASTSYATSGIYTVRLVAYGPGGDSSVATANIAVYPRPLATFTASPTSICPGSSVSFSSTVTPGVTGPVTYEWNFGDGGGGDITSATPSHTYYTPGVKNISLIVTNNAGCDTTVARSAYINVFTPASLNFSASATTFCQAPATVTFNNTSTGTGTLHYSWDFGDGGTSTATSPTYTYNTAGTYTVKLYCMDGNGCSDTLIHSAYINVGNISANFTATSLCISQTASFTNTSTAHTYSHWDFGDGGSSLADNPSHVYATIGTFPVSLIIFNGSCYDTLTQTVTVHSLPTITVDFTPASPCPAPALVNFHATVPASSTVIWNIADYGPPYYGTTTSYTFPYNSIFHKNAIVIDSNGCKDTTPVTVSVVEGIFNTNLPSILCFHTNYHYTFTLTSGTGLGSPMPYPYGIATVLWDFGDGSTSSLSAPYHEYASLGTYTAVCTVTTNNGCVFTITRTVLVTNSVATATFDATPDTVCYHNPVTFNAHALSGTVDAYTWYFHDNPPDYLGVGNGDSTITHVFNYPGVFVVTLTATSGGCYTSSTKTVVVDSPKAIIGITYPCNDRHSINFIDSSMGDDSHLWFFGDGTTSTDNSGTHTYSSYGSYTVKLITHNSRSGCTDSTTKTIQLYTATPGISISDTTICLGQPLVSVSLSDPYGQLSGWQLSPSSYSSPTGSIGYGYGTDTGVRTLTFISIDKHGCRDTFFRRLYVAHPYPHVITSSFCGGVPDPFTDSSYHTCFTTLTNFEWTFGDGTPTVASTIPSINHVYTAAGLYTVKEKVTDGFGCVDSIYVPVRIWKPTGTLSVTPNICKSIPSTYSYTSADTISNLHWVFGDGGISTATSPIHIYVDTGIFYMYVVAMDNHGCTDTLRDTVHITVPHAAYSVDTFLVCPPFRDTFFNLSTGATHYAWYYGDGGSPSVATNPNTTYVTPGIYNSMLVAFTETGCSDTARQRIHVFGFSGDFAYPDSGCGPLSVHFSAGLVNVNGVIWDYGDGNLSDTLLVDSITYTYTSVGAHTPRLIILKDGCSSSSIGDVPIRVDTVFPGFTTSQDSICVGGTITFVDTARSLFSSITLHSWDFGDGGFSAVSPVTHSFISPGPRIITATATDGWGCMSNARDTVTVFPYPILSNILGDSVLCTGDTAIWSNTLHGGRWYSEDVLIASIDSVTGIVVAHTVGTTTIHYTVTEHGCTTSIAENVTIYPIPYIPGIQGNRDICLNQLDSLVDSLSGGVWTASGGLSIVSPVSGTAAGITAGIGIVTYTFTTVYGCINSDTFLVNIHPLPYIPPIIGDTIICFGSTALYTDSLSGGYWETWDESIAIVDSSGHVTIVDTGIGGVSYIFTDTFGCSTGVDIEFYVAPVPILDGIVADTVCVYDSILITTSLPGGSWTFSDPAVAMVGSSGYIIGLSAGTTMITYTVTNAYGCSSKVHNSFTVIPIPVSAVITGDTQLCVGDTASLHCTPTGGVWTVQYDDIADINASTGLVTGVSAGTTLVTYTTTVIHTCTVSSITSVTVDSLPYVPPISGPDSVCQGLTVALTDELPGGTWSAAPSSIVVISPDGIVTGIAGGTGIVTYSYGNSLGCASFDTMTFRVDTIPVVPSLFTKPVVCLHAMTEVVGSITGGFWASLDTSIVTVGDTTFGSYVYGVDTGMGVIVYTVISIHGCAGHAYDTCVVLPLPDVALIIGDTSVCLGGTLQLYDSTPGGMWTTANYLYATIDTNGLLTGTGLGIAVAEYTVVRYFTSPIAYGCPYTVYDTILVVDTPVVAPVTGTDTICIGSSYLFTDITPGGIWVSLTPDIASVDIYGNVTGLSVGNAVIAYQVTNTCSMVFPTDTVFIFEPTPPITGITSLCMGITETLSNSSGGGTWSVDDPSIAVIDPVSGAITGLHAGTTIVSYTATNFCGTFTATANVYVTSTVYLTASSIVACQSLPGDTTTQGYVISGYAECIDVCEHSIIRYYAHGGYGIPYSWTVTGGTIINDYHDSIDVEWPGAGFIGNVAVSMPLASCTPAADACIRMIARPQANFSMSDTVICSNGTVYFANSSTADIAHPIVSWSWDFGDGSHSVLPNPSHAYESDGYYTVTLTVRNSCNCTDTQQQIIHILPDKGPSIVCPSIACTGETLTYYTDDECDIYNWTVEGGTIVSGLGTNTITVIWDAVGDDGYGYVNLNEPCMPCETSNTIRIPIIPINAPITGPSIICKGESYMYSLPLIGGTDYRWGVLGHPEAVMSYRDDHTVVVSFDAAGSYVLHGWYQNRLKLCGGDVTKKVEVVNPALIYGSRTVCLGETVTYDIPGGILEGDWTLSDITGTVLSATFGNSISYTFTTPGSYQVSVAGLFCANPITVTVSSSPAIVDSITGADTVCLNRPYTYVAHGTTPGSYIRWQVTGGKVVPVSGSDTVTVVWTDSGPKQLTANRTSTTAPFCSGPVFTYNITQEQVALELVGDTAPCANTHRDYAATYTRGEGYEWKILPDTLGSVVTGLHGSQAKVLWNNISAPRTAKLISIVNKCDSVFTDTLIIHIQSNPLPTITADSAICPGVAETFTASVGGSSYLWYFGDGTSVTTTTNTATHAYPHNPSGSEQTYLVTVAVTPDPDAACPMSGIGSAYATVLPAPRTTALIDNIYMCDDPKLITSSVTSGIGGFTIQWYRNNVTIPGATGPTFSATDIATYSYVAIGSNGCPDTSNIITFVYDCGDTGSVGVNFCDTPHAYATAYCNHINLWTDYTAPHCCQSWVMYLPDGTAQTIATGVDYTSVNVTRPGTYSFKYFVTRTTDMCVSSGNASATVSIVPAFYFNMRCAADGMDSVVLIDNSEYLSSITPTVTWSGYSFPLSTIGTGDHVHLELAADSSYYVVENIAYTSGSSTVYCYANATIVTPPAQPAVGFTATSSPICTGVPISFAPLDTVGIATYYWDFGDSSSSLLKRTQRAYTNATGGALPEVVTLRITDSIGCSADTTMIVTIQPNLIFGFSNDAEVLCSSDAPVTLIYTPDVGSSVPINYLWNTGQTTPTIAVSISGSYFVTMSDIFQCQKSVPETPIKLKFIKTPKAQIHGETHHCQGQVVVLNGDVGGDATYQWMKNGVLLPYSTPEIAMVIPPGEDTFRLIITVTDSLTSITCSDTSVPFPVHVDSPYTLPVITGVEVLDCAAYSLMLTASAVGPGTFNWSDGAFGPTDTIDAGGTYTVWFTDTNGCVTSSDTVISRAPELFTQYFPSGCYELCKDLLPVTISGPPHVIFRHWQWTVDGFPLTGGTESEVDPLAVNHAGSYQWLLDNGLCTAKTDNLDLSIKECEKCNGKFGEVIAHCNGDPDTYTIDFFIDAGATCTYTIGSDIGPMSPFSGTLTPGYNSLSYTFTTLATPPTASMFMYVTLTNADGSVCSRKIKVDLPYCEWIDEKTTGSHSDTGRTVITSAIIASAIMVYPNPASGQVNINYDYGSGGYSDRSIIIYDNMGRTKYVQSLTDVHGAISVSTGDWMPGMYIIRMVGDGKTLQTKRLIVSN